MAFPYSYDLSNPTTPAGYNWELDHDSTTQIHQHPPAQNQPSISPPAFQPQHLHPTEDNTPQVQLQPSPYQPPPTIHLQERVPPNHFRFDNINESHFQQQEQQQTIETRSSSRRPSSLRVSVDETRPKASTSPSTPTAGPSRVAHGRSARDQSHPYKRSSSGGVGSIPGVRPTSDVSLRERQSQVRPGIRSGSSILPSTISGMAAPCPAMYTWRVNTNSHQSQRNVSGGSVGGDTSVAATATSPEGTTPIPTPHSANTPLAPATRLPQVAQSQLPPPQSPQATPLKRYNIRTDVHYDVVTNIMTAMLELPGLKKSDLKITMSRCPYSRVRQLTISGRSLPVFPVAGHTVQERKFGEFARTIVVPLDTQPSDVKVTMEDGILTLRVPGGTPADPEEAQGIPIA